MYVCGPCKYTNGVTDSWSENGRELLNGGGGELNHRDHVRLIGTLGVTVIGNCISKILLYIACKTMLTVIPTKKNIAWKQ